MLCGRNIISPIVSSSLRNLVTYQKPNTICRQLLPTCFWTRNRVIHIGHKAVVTFTSGWNYSKTKFVLAVIVTAAAGACLYNLYMYFKGDDSQRRITFTNVYPYDYYNGSSYYNNYYSQNVNFQYASTVRNSNTYPYQYPNSNYNNYGPNVVIRIPEDRTPKFPNTVIVQKRKRSKKRKNKKSEGVDCTICLDNIGGGRGKKLPCGHLFHAVCIAPWLSQNRSCPNCRMSVPDERLRNSFYR